MARFNFTGVIGFNNLDSSMPPIRSGKTKSGAEYKTLNMYITLPNRNRANMELFGMVNTTIKTKDSDKNDLEFSWDDRFDPDIVKQVASYRKIVININGERHEFVTPYDAVTYVEEHMDELRGRLVTVTGNIRRNYYNNQYSDRFEIANVFDVAEDTKQIFKATLEFFWNKHGIDVSNFSDEKRIYIDGYTLEYDSDSRSNKYYPRQVILDLSKIDWENEKHAAIAQFNLNSIGAEYSNGKVKVILGKGYYSNMLICSYSNGAKEIEFDESQLTDYQKRQIELGMATKDDFRPSGSIFGSYVTEYKITRFDSRNNYADGKVKLDITDEEFEDLIFTPAVSEVSIKEVANSDTTVEVADDDDELFG